MSEALLQVQAPKPEQPSSSAVTAATAPYDAFVKAWSSVAPDASTSPSVENTVPEQPQSHTYRSRRERLEAEVGANGKDSAARVVDEIEKRLDQIAIIRGRWADPHSSHARHVVEYRQLSSIKEKTQVILADINSRAAAIMEELGIGNAVGHGEVASTAAKAQEADEPPIALVAVAEPANENETTSSSLQANRGAGSQSAAPNGGTARELTGVAALSAVMDRQANRDGRSPRHNKLLKTAKRHGRELGAAALVGMGLLAGILRPSSVQISNKPAVKSGDAPAHSDSSSATHTASGSNRVTAPWRVAPAPFASPSNIPDLAGDGEYVIMKLDQNYWSDLKGLNSQATITQIDRAKDAVLKDNGVTERAAHHKAKGTLFRVSAAALKALGITRVP